MKNSGELTELDRDLIKKFRSKIDKIKHTLCPTCNECFPSIVLVQGECRRCNAEKNRPKKFSEENNMDPGDVPEELRDLTEIEEMLIAQVFPVMSVYRLRGGQLGYRGHVINFPQDVQEFTTRLPRYPSSLDVLIVRRQSENSTSFRDFTVRRAKVACALSWLKANNRYYSDIIIDNEALQSLPSNGSIDDQLQTISEHFDDDNEEEVIARTFVPSLPSAQREEEAISNTLNRIQKENGAIIWPHIGNNPINEFQTQGYIARAFPTLYPTGIADFRTERARNIKPAEYFKHLIQYKDGRFVRHTRWKYFALNSLMRWRALQDGRIYIKQNLQDAQLTVTDIQERIAQGDKYLADRIMRFGESLRGSRQFWKARRLLLGFSVNDLKFSSTMC